MGLETPLTGETIVEDQIKGRTVFKNEELNDQNATEQAVSSSDVTSNSAITDADKDIDNKEV